MTREKPRIPTATGDVPRHRSYWHWLQYMRSKAGAFHGVNEARLRQSQKHLFLCQSAARVSEPAAAPVGRQFGCSERHVRRLAAEEETQILMAEVFRPHPL